jgi:hypothetical protein
MAVEISWHIEKRMILVDVDGNLSIEELEQMSKDIETLLDEGEAPVHIIFDLSHASPRPVKASEISKASQFLKHPKLGLHSMISSNRLINFLGIVVHNMMGSSQAYVTNKLEDAVERLKRLDTSIVKS